MPCKDCDAVYNGKIKEIFKQKIQEQIRTLRNADIDKSLQTIVRKMILL